MPEPSPSYPRTMHTSSSQLSAYQIEAVRRLVGHSIAAVGRELIIETLNDQRGSRTDATKLLGISLRTLRNKICEYNERGIIVPEPHGWRGASNGFTSRKKNGTT